MGKKKVNVVKAEKPAKVIKKAKCVFCNNRVAKYGDVCLTCLKQMDGAGVSAISKEGADGEDVGAL